MDKEDEEEDSDPYETARVAETPGTPLRDTANESIRNMYSANRSATASDVKADDSFMVIDLVGENSNQGVESTPIKKMVKEILNP